MKFYNVSTDYPNPSEDSRIITAYFEGILPSVPLNVIATDGTEVDKIHVE
jgi:hypothetical protein